MSKGLSISSKKLISAALASVELNYSQDYIGQLIRAGKVPGKKIGRAWFVDLSALVQHKLNRTQTKPEPKIEKKLAPAPAAKKPLVRAISAPFPEALPIRTPYIYPAQARVSYARESAPNLPPLLKRRTPAANKSLFRDVAIVGVSVVVMATVAVLWFADLSGGADVASSESDSVSVASAGDSRIALNANAGSAASQFAQSLGAGESSGAAAQASSEGVVVAPNNGDHTGFIAKLKSYFSDDVNVSVDQDGVAGVITPAFVTGTTSDAYSFLMVPVKSQK